MTFKDVPAIVRSAYASSVSIETITSSFERSAILPFNPEKIVEIMKIRIEPPPTRALVQPLNLQEAVTQIVEGLIKGDEPETLLTRSHRRIPTRKNGLALLYTSSDAKARGDQDQLYRVLRNGTKPDLVMLSQQQKLPVMDGTKVKLRRRLVEELGNLNLIPHFSKEDIELLDSLSN